MSLRCEPFRAGFRLRCKFSRRFFGTMFYTRGDVCDFVAWYGGDARYIGTWLDPRRWRDVVDAWDAERRPAYACLRPARRPVHAPLRVASRATPSSSDSPEGPASPPRAGACGSLWTRRPSGARVDLRSPHGPPARHMLSARSPSARGPSAATAAAQPVRVPWRSADVLSPPPPPPTHRPVHCDSPRQSRLRYAPGG